MGIDASDFLAQEYNPENQEHIDDGKSKPRRGNRRVTVIIENIDLPLLKEQKRHLVTMQHADNGLNDDERETLEGLINLLDAIQDKAEGVR